MYPRYVANAKTAVVAHRGGAGLWPENTLLALQEAAKLGADWSEIDVHMTRDGVLVVIHDDTVDRTTNGTGRVNNFTLTELKKLDAGYHWTNDNGQTFPFRGQGITIPTLTEIFTAFPQKPINLDIKQHKPAILASLRQLVSKHDMAKCLLVTSYNFCTAKTFRRLCPGIATGMADREMYIFSALKYLYLNRLYNSCADVLEVPFHLVDKRFVDAAHRQNKRIDVWTVNETAEMQRLLNLGVDAILTDYPDKLLQLVKDSTPQKEPALCAA